MAGAVVEAASQSSLNHLMRGGVFKPLGMTNTSWKLSDFSANQLAKRYDVEQCIPWVQICSDTESPVSNHLIAKVFNPPASYKKFKAYPQYGNPNYPDGGVHSSVADLAKLVLVILNDGKYEDGALLQSSSFKDMLRLQLPAELSGRQRFFWRDRDGLTGHFGSDLGVYSSLYFNHKSGDAVIILINRTPDAKIEDAIKQIMDRVREDFWTP